MSLLRNEKVYWTVIGFLCIICIGQCNREPVVGLIMEKFPEPVSPILLRAEPVQQSREPVFRREDVSGLTIGCPGVYITKQDGKDVFVLPTTISVESLYRRESNVVSRSSRVINEYQSIRNTPETQRTDQQS